MDNLVEHNTTPIKPSQYLYDAFWGLRDHNFFTPSILSKAWSFLIMSQALPMQAKWVKDSLLKYFKKDWIPYLNKTFYLELNDQSFEFLKHDGFERYKEKRNNFRNKNSIHNPSQSKYNYTYETILGLETIYVKSNELKDSPFTVHFMGNAEDAITISELKKIGFRGDNFFYNYRGVGEGNGVYGNSYSPDDLFKDAYDITKYVIANHLGGRQKLILEGRALGGAVATNVARRLREEGIEVDLILERSFSSISAFVAEQMHLRLTQFIEHYHECSKENHGLVFFLISYAESIINFYATIFLLAVSLTNLVSGVISTLGIILTYPIAFFGYMLAEGIRLIGFSLELAKVVNQIFSKLAECIHCLIDVLGSFIGVMLGFPGFIIALLVMHLLIPVMIVRNFFTVTPFIHMPTVFSLALNSINFNMNSVSEIERIVALNRDGSQTQIISRNMIDDEPILANASLNVGLDRKLLSVSNSYVHSFWYHKGDDNDPFKIETPQQTRCSE